MRLLRKPLNNALRVGLVCRVLCYVSVHMIECLCGGQSLLNMVPRPLKALDAYERGRSWRWSCIAMQKSSRIPNT